ncbi:MAG: hypothetical protein LUQ50_05595, partial [Methanospirillum sp.]|nr:hypothetical protein [Methanospirillum sp.]
LPDCKNEADPHCPEIRNESATPHIEHGFIENSATPCDESSGSWKVRTSEFCEIGRGFGTGPCDCCGTQWVHYQERMTKERLAAHPRKNRKICRTCYEVAREAEGASVRPLPGVIDAGSMTRLHTDLGRCQVCHTFKATWHDPGSQSSVCDSCRSRILREGL